MLYAPRAHLSRRRHDPRLFLGCPDLSAGNAGRMAGPGASRGSPGPGKSSSDAAVSLASRRSQGLLADRDEPHRAAVDLAPRVALIEPGHEIFDLLPHLAGPRGVPCPDVIEVGQLTLPCLNGFVVGGVPARVQAPEACTGLAPLDLLIVAAGPDHLCD